MVRDANIFAEEYKVDLNLQYPEPSGRTENGERVSHTKIRDYLKKFKVEL